MCTSSLCRLKAHDLQTSLCSICVCTCSAECVYDLYMTPARSRSHSTTCRAVILYSALARVHKCSLHIHSSCMSVFFETMHPLYSCISVLCKAMHPLYYSFPTLYASRELSTGTNNVFSDFNMQSRVCFPG